MIIDRLTQQLTERGVENPRETAVAKLKEFGILDGAGSLTPYGETRNAMTAGERAIDRAAVKSGRPADQYVYNPNTNRATLRGRRARA